jgi:hypothetical protein
VLTSVHRSAETHFDPTLNFFSTNDQAATMLQRLRKRRVTAR